MHEQPHALDMSNPFIRYVLAPAAAGALVVALSSCSGTRAPEAPASATTPAPGASPEASAAPAEDTPVTIHQGAEVQVVKVENKPGEREIDVEYCPSGKINKGTAIAAGCSIVELTLGNYTSGTGDARPKKGAIKTFRFGARTGTLDTDK
ncbi:MAG TPA: hypothetical protein VD735_02510 [Candidatus Saccharimonadales bacterium]|nr:hypothetical protein [Candidatus Saccharimonadales bacterium]